MAKSKFGLSEEDFILEPVLETKPGQEKLNEETAGERAQENQKQENTWMTEEQLTGIEQEKEPEPVKREGKASASYGTTQGRKGLKMNRMTLACSDENWEYIRIRSRQLGMNKIEFVNSCLDLVRSQDDWEAAIQSVTSSVFNPLK